jgi:hypothetical protein
MKFFADPQLPEQIVTLYTETGCTSTSVATIGGVKYSDFAIPIGCTNTNNGSSDATRVGLTADCSPGPFGVSFVCLCLSSDLCFPSILTLLLAASRISLSIAFSSLPTPSPFTSQCFWHQV